MSLLSSLSGPSARLSGVERSGATRMRKQSQSSLIDTLFETFPRGIALLELPDPQDVSTWKLVAINDLASTLVSPSIETFISSARLRLGPEVDLPGLYREIVAKDRPKTIGMIEAKGAGTGRLYTIFAFAVGAHGIGILFEDAHSFMAGRGARAHAERQLTQTCEFLGAVLWKADPVTLQFIYVSPEARAILGYWLERWTSETNFWKNHLYPDDRERVIQVCAKIYRERVRHDFEFRMITVQGQILWFHAAAEIVEPRGGRPELVGVMNDITDLKRAEERIRALSSRLMRVQDDERRHISRELHDSLGQYLTSIKINLELMKRESKLLAEQHRQLLEESSETLERCVQEVRSVSYLLHPPLLDELGLLAALRWYTAGFSERSGIDVTLNAPPRFSRLSQPLELAIFRVVQECLTNVQRHSNGARAWVTLSEHHDRAEIRITDNGVGISEGVIERIKEGRTLEGVGLRRMYERMHELGGRLQIESGAMGTAVSAVLPLQRLDQQVKASEHRDDETPKPRTAGKPLDASDVRIETATISDGSNTKQDNTAFNHARTRRGRRASRRLS